MSPQMCVCNVTLLSMFVFIRRRRWLMSAHGLERSDNPGYQFKVHMLNPERVRQPPNPFRVIKYLLLYPGLSLRSNPGLTLANAFGVNQAKRFRRSSANA